jgi:hypothetical protein
MEQVEEDRECERLKVGLERWFKEKENALSEVSEVSLFWCL